MKNISTLFFLSALTVLVACGGKDNSVDGKKAQLEQLKKEALALNANIATLEKELAAQGAGATQQAVVVTIAPVVAQDFNHFIEIQGKVESESVSFVTPRAGGGQVKAVFVKRGDRVKKGQILLQLDNSLIKQSVAAATQNIETVKAQAALAKSVYEKQKNLWEQNIGSEIQLLTAKTNAEALGSQLKAAMEQLGMAKDQLAYTTVRSDVDGVAEEVNIKVGEIFMGAGQLKVVNTDRLKLTSQVPENYAGKIKVGTDVSLIFPDLNKTMDTKLTVVGNVIDPLSRSFFVEAKLPVNKDFRPNQLAQVKIKDYTKKNAISIPINIVQNDDKGKFVYVAATENGKLVARKRPVTIGEFYANSIEILSGINAGEQVVTEGYQSLFDGQLLTVSTSK
ncbi:MAG: efflux RND transporter periplasmic adaptor subunit [Sediminibacterium sp.]